MIEHSQSVKDALADAETLRLFCWAHPQAQPTRAATFSARHHGQACNDPMFSAGMVKDCATLAARAAFRAVPGLRG